MTTNPRVHPNLSVTFDLAKTRAYDGTAEAQSAISTKLETRNLSIKYREFTAIRDISLSFPERKVSALIGSSGSGKSTLLRAINRMHDSNPTVKVDGQVLLEGEPIYGAQVDPISIRRRIGMVFQRPNPFTKSIFDNVAYGLSFGSKLSKSEIKDRVEEALRSAALWDEVKDRLNHSALALSGGQQQRICIARALAVRPEALLMDEPTSALDPIATLRIEELMRELVKKYTIVIVTHNMQQAARVSDTTAFMAMGTDRAGELIEVGPTSKIFTNPSDSRTEDYITGRVG
ncbi:MAG TPA: phosphate ABC transporter ATP-binding protein PstB [Nitrolancea sp.]|jgi:phosphate transport system ATP-binding protein|nr:phosphate ABC transporter ATP-binding protein PstB [Nitrolancea sp.]